MKLSTNQKFWATLSILASSMLTAPGNYRYTIFDCNGKVINRGQLTNGINNININNIIAGMYMITLYWQ